MPEGLVQMEGSEAVATTIARCRPGVVCAYPISPQTHIVEGLAKLIAAGKCDSAQFLTVESEFAAMSASIGASATGARAYTATASQGLLYMTEALYNASGLGLPIVMTVANRAIGAPINIWNDHSDTMSQRDSGWLQLYVDSNQAAVDVHVQAFALAERLSLPVMVCMDGFVLTHASERLELPSQAQVDELLPPFRPRQVLDPRAPATIGAMVGPEAFTEVRYLGHLKQMQALDLVGEIASAYEGVTGRSAGGLLHPYRTHDADTIVVALGSVVGTVCDVVDDLRRHGERTGCLGIRTYRPWPEHELVEALAGAGRVIVIDRALAPGIGGPVARDILATLRGHDTVIRSVIAGLGGRPVTRRSLHRLLEQAQAGQLGELTMLDLDHRLVDRELTRIARDPASGPHAENMLADLGAVRAGPV